MAATDTQAPDERIAAPEERWHVTPRKRVRVTLVTTDEETGEERTRVTGYLQDLSLTVPQIEGPPIGGYRTYTPAPLCLVTAVIERDQ